MESQIQQNPNPPPPGQNPSHPSTESYSSHFQYYPNLILQPNDPLYLNPTLPGESAVAPPGVDPYPLYPNPNTHFSYALPSDSTVPYAHQQLYQTVTPPGYYSEADSQNWVALEAVRRFGLDPAQYGGAQPVTGISIPPNGTEQLTTANVTSSFWTYPTLQPNGNASLKMVPKKTKIVQSAYCGICKVDCNSKDVLEQHKLGKKHKKNVEKLKQCLVPTPTPTPAPPPAPTQNNALPGSNDPVIGPPENPEKAKVAGKQNSKKKAAGTVLDLESKRRRVLEGGAAAEAVRTCHICNVVCNSDTVFSYHIAGQKHAAMVKKHLSRRT